jgi:hypothetical protein
MITNILPGSLRDCDFQCTPKVNCLLFLEIVLYTQLAIQHNNNNNNNNNSIQFNSSLLMCPINSQKANYTNSTTYKHK